MMQAFRNSAKPIITIVAISFFAWLVFDLSGLTGGSGLLTTTSVGKVNGRSIDSRLFQEAVSRFTEQRQQQSAEPLGLAELAQIRDQVWEQFIQETILDQEYKKWGISVSSAEIAEIIRQSPAQEFRTAPDFQTDGEFDQTKYERWLASATGQGYIPILEQDYRNQVLQSKLARHIAAPVYVSDAELWQRYRDQNELLTVGVVKVPFSVLTDEAISVTPSEIESFYRTRREELRRERTAWLSFVTVDRRPNGSDSAAALSHALDLRSEIEGGAPFAEVARRESADTVSGLDGGNLGEWTRGRMDPAFDSAAFSLPIGTLSEPVLTPFGYHLIQVSQRSGDKVTGAHILIPVELAGAHRREVDARADSLEALAADRLDPAALDTAASALGLPILQSGAVVESGPVAVLPDAAVWSRQAEVGEHSPVIETRETFHVFRVDSIREAGIPSLEEARPEIEARLRAEKQKVEARSLAQDIVNQAQNGKPLATAAEPLGLTYRVIGPFAPVTSPEFGGMTLGAAIALSPGERAGPAEWGDGFWVLELLNRVEPDSSVFATQLATLRDQAISSARQATLQQYFAGLRKMARIVDNRDLLYRTAAQIAASDPTLQP